MKVFISRVLLVLLVCQAKARLDDAYMNRLLNMANDDSEGTDSLFNVLSLPEVKKGSDEDEANKVFPENNDDMKDTSEFDAAESLEEGLKQRNAIGNFIKNKIGKVATSAFKKGTKRLRSKLKGMANKFKSKALSKVPPGVKQAWKKFQAKLGDNVKAKGKKMMKAVLKEIYETGKEEALDMLAASVEEWIQDKLDSIGEELCECFYTKKPGDDKLTPRQLRKAINNRPIRKCRCCIRPPGFKSACLKIVAKLKSRSFDVRIATGGQPIVRTELVVPEMKKLMSPCSVPDVAEPRADVCGPMPGAFHFLSICIAPGHVEIDEEEITKGRNKGKTKVTSFGACFQVKLGKLKLSFEKCVQYDFDEREISFFDPNEEEGDEEEEEEEEEEEDD